MIKKNISHRHSIYPDEANDPSIKSDLKDYPQKLQQIFLSRGIRSKSELDHGLAGLIPPSKLLNTDKASQFILQAIKRDQRILIIGDFDADGATSSTLMVKALTSMGAKNVNFLVPDRFKFGYGLSVNLL